MEKRVFRNFRYSECDDFASFLSKMASEGWHFKGWELGLIFEQGEPEEARYAVEIFVKGSELDLKATKDTEEYVEFCKEAGWEFIDSSRKFVVFKKIKEDADEIMTIEEQLEYVANAEIKALGSALIGSLLLAGWYFSKFISEGFYYSIFSYGMFAVNAAFCIWAIYSLIRFVKILRWSKCNKEKILRGKEIIFGIGEERQRKKVLKERGLTIAMATVLIMVMAFVSDLGTAMIVAAFGGLFCICICFIEAIRPNKATYVGSLLAVSIMVPLLFCMFVLVNPIGDNICTDKSKAPLLQEDYREVEAPFMQVQIDESENFLGSICSHYVTYHEYNENPDNEIWDNLDYTVIESDYDWIIDRSYKLLTSDKVVHKECSEEWGALEAIQIDGYPDTVFVRYEDQILMLDHERNLSQQQIGIIRDKLNLGQVM